MSWNRERIDAVAIGSAHADYAMFEAIGLSEIPDASVLDVGCFDGFNTVLKFKPYSNVRRVVGVDPEAANIALARQATDDERFSWAVADAETYDAAEASFDAVYFSHVLQHVADKEQALQNAFRLLKPGGFVVIKTIDDALMVSYPDPVGVMRQALKLYDSLVRPFRAHTRHTDRYLGSKCYSLLKLAGFDSVSIRVLFADTSGKGVRDRLALFDRVTYYRRQVPDAAGEQAQQQMDALMAEWCSLFMCDDYYFATPTVLAIARKPGSDGVGYQGPLFGQDAISPLVKASGDRGAGEPWSACPMDEAHLGEVMAIEIDSFPDPWAPLAYVTEIRHNRQARYLVALDGAGKVCGFVGWWLMPDEVLITHIAVARSSRRAGLGGFLLNCAIDDAIARAKSSMKLIVRASNAGARRFYESMGFEEASRIEGYYSNPDEAGVVMYRAMPRESR